MLFTWDTTNLCIVFRSWRITDTTSLVLSLVAVMALTAGYEAVREAGRRYELRHVRLLENVPRKSPSLSSLLLLFPPPISIAGSVADASATYCTAEPSPPSQPMHKGLLGLASKDPTTTTTAGDVDDDDAAELAGYGADDGERRSFFARRAGNALAAEEKKGRIVKAALYGVQVFYSFFIM